MNDLPIELEFDSKKKILNRKVLIPCRKYKLEQFIYFREVYGPFELKC